MKGVFYAVFPIETKTNNVMLFEQEIHAFYAKFEQIK